MVKTTRQFYIVVGSVMLGLTLVLAFLLVQGDQAGQPLKAELNYLPEGPGGLPQIALTFQGKGVPAQSALEDSFEITPAVPGDFSWKDSTLFFSPAGRLRSDTQYQVRLRGGLKLAGGGRSGYGQTSWIFQTRPDRVAFLKKEGNGVNLWLSGAGSGESPAQPLTFETQRQVLDFTVSPGGERIVYSLAEPGGSEASLWLVKTTPGPGEQPRRLLYEAGIRATAPRWSPGGDLIAYERRLVLSGGAFSQPQLWLIQSDGTSLAPLYGGSERSGVELTWAARGSKAFFWEPKRQALGVFSFGDEPAWETMPGVILQSVAPSPDGREVILASYDYSGATQKQILTGLALKPSKGHSSPEWQTMPLSLNTPKGYSDFAPGWSPDGKLVAFLRQNSQNFPKRAGQLWLYEPQSGKVWPLVPETGMSTETSSDAYQWSPDGQKLLFEQISSNPKSGSKASAIWEISLDGQTKRQIALEAFSPQWIN